MLTVKHVARDKTETLYEAKKVEVIKDRGLGEDGIFLDRERFENGGITGGYTYEHVIHFENSPACSSDQVSPVVYVMNRYGTTVARYPL